MLFEPTTVGAARLANRIVMAPLTRSRSNEHGLAGPLHAEYYRQRASAGLIITEGTSPSADGLGYARTPGIYTPAQIESWRLVTDAVHQEGGKIFVQMMHVGRIAHPLNQPAGARIVAPSAIPAAIQMWTDAAGQQDVPAPEELTIKEIQGVMGDFRQGVLNARDAGFDGVELHAANGYLLNQFLSTNSNRRIDAYGGSVERRARFVLELFDVVAQAWTNGRIGIRFSPGGGFNDIRDEEPEPMYTYLARELSKRKPAYVHVVRPGPFTPAEKEFDVPGLFRREFSGTLMLNGGFTAKEAEALLISGSTDLVSFGRPFISTPNLPEVFRNGWQIAPANYETFYTPGPAGYVDYPPVAGVLEAAV